MSAHRQQDGDGLEQILGQAVLDSLDAAHLTVKEAAYLTGWNDTNFRHALRAAVAAAPAIAFTLLWFTPYDHWLTITIVATMQPYFGMTFQKGSTLVACVNLALEEMKADQTLQGITTEWLSTNTNVGTVPVFSTS